MSEIQMFTNDSETRWREDGINNQWCLPERSHRFFRLPVIRHLRALYHTIRVEWHYTRCPVGLRTGYDEWVLYAIARGWC